MGYEYDNLLRRYGLATDKVSYAGAAKPEDSAEDYDSLMSKYNTDYQTYSDWLKEYQNRLDNFNLYGGDYKGELLQAPTYKYGYVPLALPKPVVSEEKTEKAPEEKPAAPPEQSGGNGGPSFGGGNPNGGFDTLQDAINTPTGALTVYGLSKLGLLGPMTQDGMSVPVSEATVTANPNAHAVDFSHMSPTEQAAVTNAADPIGALADALGMGPGTGVSSDTGSSPSGGGSDNDSRGDSSGGSAAGTNGSTGNDTDHGDGSAFRMGGLVQKYEDGGLAEENNRGLDLSRVSPQQMQLMAQEDPEALMRSISRFQSSQKVSPAANLLALTAKYYGPQEPASSVYADELRAARQVAKAETDAFNKHMTQAMAQKSEGPSRAEMYFKLAAAFGAPTKTGHFGETLANASGVMAEHAKASREASSADAARKLQLGITSQQARMAAAKDDVTALRALAGKELDDQRARATELMKLHFTSGKPQSEAGKIAADMGLQIGSPEYAKFVDKYVTDKIESGQFFKEAMREVAVQKAGVALSAEERKLREEAMLTPAEGKAVAAEQTAADAKLMLARNLEKAYQLNKKALSGSGLDRATGAILGAVGYPSDQLKAEEELTQLLTQASLDYASRLKPMSDADARLAQKLTGLLGTSSASRAAQIQALYEQTQAEVGQHRSRIEDTRSRKNRTKSPVPATIEEAP